MQELPSRGLSQKASTRLVQEVLGPELPEEGVARLVEQAAGNALFLATAELERSLRHFFTRAGERLFERQVMAGAGMD